MNTSDFLLHCRIVCAIGIRLCWDNDEVN